MPKHRAIRKLSALEPLGQADTVEITGNIECSQLEKSREPVHVVHRRVHDAIGGDVVGPAHNERYPLSALVGVPLPGAKRCVVRDAFVASLRHMQSAIVRGENHDGLVCQAERLEFGQQDAYGIVEGLDDGSVNRFESPGIFFDERLLGRITRMRSVVREKCEEWAVLVFSEELDDLPGQLVFGFSTFGISGDGVLAVTRMVNRLEPMLCGSG